jgi:Trm5-related predicted tRNA methylase
MGDKYYELKEEYFPNYDPFVLGGCVISYNSPKEKTTKICPKCKEEYLRPKEQLNR